MANVLGELFQDIADAIRSNTGGTDTLKPNQFPSAIEGITTGGGGGSAEGCVTVTFMNGDVELFKRPVYIGDDCPEPVAQGRFDAPNKESTPQYNYTFYGWGASDGGAADANILKNITEDKTVYAIFTATVRYYTITYYDSDGITVLHTESLAYGTTPTYIGSKDGYNFEGWSPELAVVTGDASYIGQFSEAITFAGASWADIARISEAGEASHYFSIGDTKTVKFNGNSLEVMIVGFDHDDLADGSGKAGISIIATQLTKDTHAWKSRYDMSEHSTISAMKDNFTDEGLADAIKLVSKMVDSSINKGTSNVTKNVSVYVWLPSPIELAPRTDSLYNFTYETTEYITNLGSTYEAYANASDIRRMPAGESDYALYATRGIHRAGGWYPIGFDGSWNANYFQNITSTKVQAANHLLLGFCV